ncbi:SET [Seminavis robusta]|uniref:SET n=1 Tax=Seminavis robusta TaxID=568900 RepID=A0A9N8DVN7_9STRA|nr:SET [Seminavis robusta]|eukprot:Sro387_g132030.1 SET (381) ;mRNA; f:14617-15759
MPSATAESAYDPRARSCAWCYAVLLTTTTGGVGSGVSCAACPRSFCSGPCRDMDWSTHSFWCGKAGEKGVDFEICHISGKGLGMIAKRSFERGEKILAERPVLTTTNVVATCNDQTNTTAAANESIRVAAMSLTPLQGSLDDKVHANGVCLESQDPEQPTPPPPPQTTTTSNSDDKENSEQDDDDDDDNMAAGLFLTFSRVNHDCLGNADHYFDHQHGVELLVANHRIEAQTEITFPYTRSGKQRQICLEWRGFTCHCKACQIPFWNDQVNAMCTLDSRITQLGGCSCDQKRAKAVQSAKTLLVIYDRVQASCRDYARVHYDLFQILVLQNDTMPEARRHMLLAHDYALSFCGYDQHETVLKYRGYVDHPERHGNYRAID